MSDILDPRHEAQVEFLFRRACMILQMPGFELRPLRRRARGTAKLRSYSQGYTKIGEKVVTIDLYTPHNLKPRKLSAIFRVVCHELAHHQKPPRIYRVWFHHIRRIHHPAFWQQYKKNVVALAQDEILGQVMLYS